jgi:hypothetical protein
MSDTASVVDDEAPASPAIDPLSIIQALGSGGADSSSLLLSQLASQAGGDPRLAALLQMLQQRSAAAKATETKPEDAEPHPEAMLQAQQERDLRIQQLTDSAQKMAAELKVLRERNDALAAALGACFLCFGSDPLCDECNGEGAPGSKAPDPVAYRTYVLPALVRIRRVQAERARRPEREVQSGPPGAEFSATLVPTASGGYRS